MKDVTVVEPDYDVGEQVDLVVPEDPLEGTYSTVVTDMKRGSLEVEVPQVNGLYLPLEIGDTVVLKQYDQGATFEGETSVETRDDRDGTPFLRLKEPDTVRRIQRRDFVRVPCDLEAVVNVMDAVEDGQKLTDPVKGTIDDISAGGVQLTLDQPLPLFTEIELVFTLPVTETTLREVFGEVVRAADEGDAPYVHGVEFTSITESKRNDIIQFVYERQRELKD